MLTTTLPAMVSDTIAALARDRTLHVMEWLGERALHRPTPTSARFLLEAHRLFLEIGDEEEEARRTAAFHVGGLIELARRLSEKKAYRDAAALYADVERILNERATSEEADLVGALKTESARDLGRLRSYVVHYKHYNRYRGGLEEPSDVLQGFRRARGLWPDNALWYTHEMDVLFGQGRDMDALRLREDAYAQVKQHPRRHELLTGRPAEAAWQARRPITALELLLKLGLAWRTDLTLAPAWNRVLGGWSRGMDLVELPGHGRTRVVFPIPLRATLKEASGEWIFEMMAPLDVFARSTSPDEAIHKAGDELAAEVRRLVQPYADELTIPATCRPSSEPDKLWFAKVATCRDGRPTGEVLACEPSTGRARSAE